MRWRERFTVCLVCLGISVASCKFADNERCPDGYFYVENLLSCCEEGNSIYHPGTKRCHITQKQPSNCENEEFVFLSVSYKDKNEEQVSEQMCCPPDMTYYDATECEDPVEPPPDDGGTGGPPSGLGDLCTPESSDCDSFEADYCLKHPLEAAKSYCTLLDCENTAECGSGFTCCDCLNQNILQKAVACLRNEDANLAKAFCECDI